MAFTDEAAAADGPLAAALNAGLESIDRSSTVTFTEYTKYTFSEDGYVFWVATSNTVVVNGSLHVATDRLQAEDQTIGVNHVIFTAETEVSAFSSISPTTMWIGSQTVEGSNTIQVVFSKRASYYQEADLWHYLGDAVYPALSAQIIASSADLPTAPIVGNSLPIWLSQNTYANVYPSFLVPDNVAPPYITAHIEPSDTIALGAFPILQWPGNPVPTTALQPMGSDQLMRDKVRLTLYGFTNATAIQYLQSLIDYSVNTDSFGFMNKPAIQDDKRMQAEIAALAMKKTIDITASYYQSTADTVARRLILSAAMSITVS